MNINFTSSAEEYLQNRLKNKNIVDYRFILDYTDGQSPYNDDMIGCHCQDYTKYRLLIVLKNDNNIDEEKYDKSFEINLGEIRYPSFYEMMLDKDNLIDYLPNSYGLYLKSEAGIITPQVKLLEIEY